MLTHEGLLAQYVSCIVAGEYAATDVMLHALPLYHCAQMHCFIMPGLYLGAKNVILPGAGAGRGLRRGRRPRRHLVLRAADGLDRRCCRTRFDAETWRR